MKTIFAIMATFAAASLAVSAGWSEWKHFTEQDGVKFERRFYTTGSGFVQNCQWRATNLSRHETKKDVKLEIEYVWGGRVRKLGLFYGMSIQPGKTKGNVSDHFSPETYRSEPNLRIKSISIGK